MALREQGDCREVDLQLVPGHDLLYLGFVIGGERRCELAEVLGEAARRDGFEEAQWLVAGVPEGVRLLRGFPTRSPGPASILRDAEVLPSLRRMIEPGLGAYGNAARTALRRGYGRSRRVEAAVRLVADFHSWRARAPLGENQAVELAAEIVELAARAG